MTGLFVAMAVLWAFIVREARLMSQMKSELVRASGDFVDEDTTLLTPAALAVRLVPELESALHRGKRVAMVVYRVHRRDPTGGAQRLRRIMRQYEDAYLLDDRTFLVALYDSSYHSALLATARLGASMGPAGCGVVDAGVAMFPDEGMSVNGLLELATSRLRPVQEHGDLAATLPWARDAA